MTVKVRFAPSPTGKVHIGNLRAAIFNWLFARHEGGEFLLRVEDTDRERSTQEAIEVLLDALAWTGLDWDGEPVYQSRRLDEHRAAAARLREGGLAYAAPPRLSAWAGLDAEEKANLPEPVQALLARLPGEEEELRRAHQAAFAERNARKKKKKQRPYLEPLRFTRPTGAAGEPALHFRLPYRAEGFPCLQDTEEERVVETSDAWPVLLSADGLEFIPAARVRGGEPLDQLLFELENRSLCGFQGLELLDGEGRILARLEEHLEALDAGRRLLVPGVATLRFRRRYLRYRDLVKGELAKPVEGLKNRVLLRSDGTPVFHLANVVDDHDMGVTHIVRGDDHVENTYWHQLLFHALGWEPPAYGHLPMIVNEERRPLSKRDGDVYVGEYRRKGILPEALFNYLALLGWSPGEDREKVSRAEMVELFTLERVIPTAARFDMDKLLWLNGLYLAERSEAELARLALPFLREAGVPAEPGPRLEAVLALEKERVRSLAEIPAAAAFFFAEEVAPRLDEKKVRKAVAPPETPARLTELARLLAALEEFAPVAIERALRGYAEERELGMGKVSQPLRVAVTGGVVSPPIGETLALVGRERVLARIEALAARLEAEGGRD